MKPNKPFLLLTFTVLLCASVLMASAAIAEAQQPPHPRVILYAMLVPKGHAGRLAYLSEFIEEAKASGLVRQAIERAGLRGVQVAPAGNPSTH